MLNFLLKEVLFQVSSFRLLERVFNRGVRKGFSQSSQSFANFKVKTYSNFFAKLCVNLSELCGKKLCSKKSKPET